MTTPTTLYPTVRRRLIDLTTNLDEERQRVPVPATPLWTVRDVVAHLAGVVADTLAGNLAGLGRPEWTARQVADRADRSLTEICREWADAADAFDPLLADPNLGAAALDLWQHEQDIRAALGVPVDRDPEAVTFVVDAVAGFATANWPSGRPAVTLVAPELDRHWRLGDGESTDTVTAEGYELARALCGRRSRAQLIALGWRDPAPHLAATVPFAFPERDLVE